MDFRQRFPLRIRRPGVDEEVDAELDFHLEMRRLEMLEHGLTDAQARQSALERFGDLSRARRECRALGHQREHRMRVLQFIAELRQDAAFALRQMLAARAFSIVAVATLALGIGATTAIFSVVHAVVLRPLPFPAPDRIVVVNSGWRGGLMSMAPAHYLHLASEQTAFESLAAVEYANFTLARDDGADRLIGARVTAAFFDVFRVAPALGGVFGAAEDEPGRDAVVVLGHRVWTRDFSGDPSLVGRSISLNQRPYTVLGVMPASFDSADRPEELWVPMALTPERKAIRTSHFLTVYARLRDGVSIGQADAQMPGIIRSRVRLWPQESSERTLHVTPLIARVVGDYRERLFVLFAAVALVLLIACGNVSNLLLARGAVRARELAVRSAIGAGQGRLVRQLLTESLVLGVVSAAAGVALAVWLVRLLIAFAPAGVPRLEQAAIDTPVLAFAALLAIAAGATFGTVPAWRASRTDLTAMLKDAGRGAGARGGRDVVRSVLIAAEVALAIVLLVGAALLIRTALEMQRIRPGFDPAGVFAGRILIPTGRYTSAAAMRRIVDDLEARAAAVPGVRAAAVASTVPGARSFSNGLLPEGKPLSLEHITQSDGVFVSTGYFAAMRLPIVQGRAFADADRDGAPLVVILNRTAARQMWPGEEAIGKRLSSANPRGLTTVIGIAEDVRLGGPSEPAPPTFYVPIAQLNEEAWGWSRSLFAIARTDGDPAVLGPPIRRIVSNVDPAIPLFDARTMAQRMAATLETARFNTRLLVFLGGAGLLLAAVGIYGVVSYFAAARTSEIGVRIALGATRADVTRLVVGQAIVPVLAGVAAGVLAALFSSRALASQLVNVRTTDPIAFAAVGAGLLAVALLAAMIPARRAARLDPTRALQTT